MSLNALSNIELQKYRKMFMILESKAYSLSLPVQKLFVELEAGLRIYPYFFERGRNEVRSTADFVCFALPTHWQKVKICNVVIKTIEG